MEIKNNYSEFEHFIKLEVFEEPENVVPPSGSEIYRYKSYGSTVCEAEAILKRSNDLVLYVLEIKFWRKK